MNIAGINGIGSLDSVRTAGNAGKVGKLGAGNEKNSFINSVKKGIDSLKETQAEADSKVKEALSGKDADLSEVMISTLKAELSMQLTLQIRNKALDAYQEITRMSI